MVKAANHSMEKAPLEGVVFQLSSKSMKCWKQVSNIFWFMVPDKQQEIHFAVWVRSIGSQLIEALNYIAMTNKDLKGKKWSTEKVGTVLKNLAKIKSLLLQGGKNGK